MTEIIGWVSSFILFLTVSRQIYKQWKAGTSDGVSIWLFYRTNGGFARLCRLQLASLESGFCLYQYDDGLKRIGRFLH